MAEQKKQEKQADKKLDALQTALSQIEKQFGKGSIMRLGADVKTDIAGIPTGSLALDMALGGRGIPRGRVIEIFGPEASGKTTLCLHIAANAQRLGGTAAFIDVEHAMDPAYTQRIGVNLDDLIISQPDSGEQALETTDLLVRSNAIDLVIIDSVAALVPRSELEGEMGEMPIGLQARLMSQALRKLTASISKSRTAVIFTNQIRMKIGVMWGNPETTPGGRALKFYASVRLDIRRIGAIKDGEQIVGSRIRVNVVKNKIAPPFKKAEFDIMHTCGICKEGDLIDLATTLGHIDKSGTWLAYKDNKLGQGREKARAFLKEHSELAQQIEAEVRKAHGLEPGPAATEAKKEAK